MKYIPDKTGRFRQRPHYTPSELDFECEKIISEFMRDSCGKLALPIPTDALTKLIERDAQDLDLYADLTVEGMEIQGVTDFFPNQKPKVRISKELSNQPERENRLRTTLTHEYGHVKFHAPLWQMDNQSPQMFADLLKKASPKCNRDGLLNAPQSDWMEWQAGYICGSMLMPVSQLRHVVAAFFENNNIYGPVQEQSVAAQDLTREIVSVFQVSQDAARVRLFKLGHLTTHDAGPSLFR